MISLTSPLDNISVTNSDQDMNLSGKREDVFNSKRKIYKKQVRIHDKISRERRAVALMEVRSFLA